MHPKTWQCTSSQYVPSNCADTLCTIWPRPGPNYLPCLVHVHSKCQPLVPAPPCLSLILGWPYGWRDLKIQLLNNFHFASLKEIQTEVVLTCLSFIRSGQNHLARHSERGKKTRQTEEEVRRQHQEMDRPGVRQVPEDSEEQVKTSTYGATTTLVVKG